MNDTATDARLFKALSNENNLRLLRALFDGERALDEIGTGGAYIDELEENQLIRKSIRDGRVFIRLNKVGRFRAMGILESYLKSASDLPSCGMEQ